MCLVKQKFCTVEEGFYLVYSIF